MLVQKKREHSTAAKWTNTHVAACISIHTSTSSSLPLQNNDPHQPQQVLMKKTNRNKTLTFFEANALAGDKANRPPPKPSHGLEASTAPPPILILLPSQCYSSIATQLLARLAEGSQPNLLTLPADGVISSRGDCTLCQQQEHVSLWSRPPEKPPGQKPMPSCWIWAVVLLQGYLHLPFSTRAPELGTNASLWAWWAQCAGVDLPHL